MERKHTEVPSGEHYQKRVKVLLVDDKVSEILPLKSMMQFLNCDIEVAQSGAEGLQSIIPIIALTANAFKQTKEEAFDAGMTDFLTKPMKVQDVEDMLNKYIV